MVINMENEKYVKVMFGLTSGANGFKYKLNEVNIADNWNPKKEDAKEMGGFNFSVENKILRYLIRGDTIYDVELPTDAEVIDCPSSSCPHGVFRTNKIIIKNPHHITDEVAFDLYKKSNLPEKSYYKSLIGCAIRGNINTAKQIIKDKVNKENIDLVLNEVNDFLSPGYYWDKKGDEKAVNEVLNILNNIKNS